MLTARPVAIDQLGEPGSLADTDFGEPISQ